MENRGLGNFCNAKFSVIGFADDLAVKNVNGRLGARSGPAKFLEYLKKLKGELPILESILHEEVPIMSEDLDSNHREAARLIEGSIKKFTSRHDSTIAVGGGHDYAYPWLLGIRRALANKTRLACINLDAHFDLRDYRPVMTSGSPFRRLIDEGVLAPSRLVEFGIQNHCNGRELWDYARKSKIKTLPMERLRNGKAVSEFKRVLGDLRKKADVIAISLDLDAISLAYAPGVSAPQPEGFTASEAYQMLEIAGADPKVRSLGIFELAPPLDVQDQTARLAAQAAWKFMVSKSGGKSR